MYCMDFKVGLYGYFCCQVHLFGCFFYLIPSLTRKTELDGLGYPPCDTSLDDTGRPMGSMATTWVCEAGAHTDHPQPVIYVFVY